MGVGKAYRSRILQNPTDLMYEGEGDAPVKETGVGRRRGGRGQCVYVCV